VDSPRHVFITGASSGIGAALARHYAAGGAVLGLVGRREEALRELAGTLPAAVSSAAGPVVPAPAPAAAAPSPAHRCYAIDVRDRSALHAAARDFIARCGGAVDLVIASAGISAGTLIEHAEDFEVFEAIIDTNVLATVATFEPFAAAMRQAGRGTLVGISSVAGVRGLPGSSAYCASKAAVTVYCESLRVELSRHGVRVVTIAPGYIRTPMTRHNPYSMPFLMEPDAFAARAARAIARGMSYTVIPWQMGIVARLLRLIPNWLFDRATRNVKTKPRHRAAR
jgi:NAD(P)-dependent dehydrogenase (short-subunit alcohol dehydrogenase family)